jgi:transposase
MLRFELDTLVWFAYQRPAYQVALEYTVSYHKVTRVYQQLRRMIFHQCELEGKDFSGEIEMDESYFGGRKKGSVYYTDKFKSYNSLSQYGKHLTVNHSKEYVSSRHHHHINGIEGFWSYAKHKLYNYRGVSKSNFPLYLKEMEFRYNHRKENLLSLLKVLFFS